MTAHAAMGASRALAWLYAQSWAMPTANLQQMLAIASRTNEVQLNALLADPGTGAPGARYTSMRGQVAVLEVEGPIFRRANLFTAISGATSHEILAQEFQEAIRSPNVAAVVLAIDSPGGQVSGTSELARLIYASRGRKPIVAHVAMAASAAYWIAAAADRIVISDTGQAGSIGVVQTVDVRNDPDVIEIVSSQSPGKRPDATTESGRAQLQATADEIAQVFIDAVAEFRGVSSAKVLSDFGQGAMRVGLGAVTFGMANQVGTLEQLLASLGADDPTGGQAQRAAQGPAEQWAASADLRQEFPTAAQYVAFVKASRAGLVRIAGHHS